MPSRGVQRDRWLLSYADFITLLFAAFVLMYATAKAKEQQSPSPSPKPVESRPILPNPVEAQRSNLLTELQNKLHLEQQNGLLMISTEPRGVVIALDTQTCFEAGQAEIHADATAMFEHVADILSRYKNRILLEGHTDSVPIHNARFRSNWELSTARSIAVLELMENHAGLSPDRFLIGGSADNAPVSSNETEQGRAINRRVDIVVLDSLYTTEAAAAAHPVSYSVR